MDFSFNKKELSRFKTIAFPLKNVMEETEKEMFPIQNLYMELNIFSFQKCLFSMQESLFLILNLGIIAIKQEKYYCILVL